MAQKKDDLTDHQQITTGAPRMQFKQWHEAHRDSLSVGAVIADKVAGFIGSWTFVIIQTVLMTLWVIYNTTKLYAYLHGHPFDPFPFVFLNLFMSAEAAYSTPLIMMSQNRAAERDRAHAQHDFEVNCKSLAMLQRMAEHFDVRLDHLEDDIDRL